MANPKVLAMAIQQLTDVLRKYPLPQDANPPRGGWLRALRKAMGMTQAQLGARLNVSPQAVLEFENAEVKRRITLDSLDRAARAMGCRVVYAPGATPLDSDEAAGLIPSHIANHAQLNEWELANIVAGERWAFARKRRNLLETAFVRRLSRTMGDLLLILQGAKGFSWGEANLVSEGMVRQSYLDSLRAADRGDYGPLLTFVRS